MRKEYRNIRLNAMKAVRENFLPLRQLAPDLYEYVLLAAIRFIRDEMRAASNMPVVDGLQRIVEMQKVIRTPLVEHDWEAYGLDELTVHSLRLEVSEVRRQNHYYFCGGKKPR